MFEKTGCQIVMVLVGALVLLSLIVVVPPTCRQNGGMTEDSFAIASVGDRSLTMRQFQDAMQLAMGQFGGSFGSAYFEFSMKSDILAGELRNLAMLQIADQRGVSVTDEDVLESLDQGVELQRMQIRMQLEQEGILQPGATEQEFQQAAAEDLRRMEENMAAQREMIASRLENEPAFRQLAYGSIVRPRVAEAIARNLPVSQEDIIRSLDNFVVRRMSFADPELDYEQNLERAREARAELDAGADFVATMQKYFPDLPTDSIQLPRTTIKNNPTYEAILDIQAGSYTRIVEAGVPTIYFLERVEENVPENFEDNIDIYRSQYASQEANAVLEREIDDFLAGQQTVWHIESYRIAYKLNHFIRNDALENTREQNKEAYLALANEARSIYLDTVEEIDMAALSFYVAFDAYYSLLDEAQRSDEEVVEMRIESLEAARESVPDVDLELELAELYMSLGDQTLAAERIIEAAILNVDFQMINESQHERISAFVNEAEAAGTISPEDVERARRELERWAREKARYDQDMLEMEEELGSFEMP